MNASLKLLYLEL